MDWREQYRVSGIVALGGCLEFYDFVIFLFFTDVIGQQFFPVGMPSWLTTVQVWGLFAAGYLFRPLGGIVLAHFGDLFGRQRVFAFSILLMAASTLGIGLLPTYQAVGIVAPFLLLFFRILQGIAIGGELPGAWTFVTEHVPPNRVGLVCGTVCCGLTLGILLATSAAAGVTSTLSLDDTQAWGWRLPFLLGGLFGLAGMKLRRMLNETPVFTSLRQRRMLVPELPLGAVLKTEGRGVVRSVFVTWVLSSVVVLTIMLPMTLHGTFGFEKESALCAASISTLCLAIGVVIGGALLDLIGAAKFYLLFSVLLLGAAVCYYNMSGASMVELNVLAGLVGLAGGVCAGTPYVMVSSFPARIRYTGVSFAYNVSYAVFGGVIPLVVNSLSPIGALAHVLYFSVISLFAFGLGVSLLLRGEPLEPSDV